ASACRKSFFDKLLAFFRTFQSSEKRLIENERHPSWVISAPSAAALRRLRSESRLRAQSFVAIFLPVFSDHWVYRQTEAGPVSGPACSDILLDGVDGALLQPAHLGLGDAHLGADLHLGLALVEPQGEDAPLPVVQPLHGLL